MVHNRGIVGYGRSNTHFFNWLSLQTAQFCLFLTKATTLCKVFSHLAVKLYMTTN